MSNKFYVTWQNKDTGGHETRFDCPEKAAKFEPEPCPHYPRNYDFKVMVTNNDCNPNGQYVGEWTQSDFEEIYKAFK